MILLYYRGESLARIIVTSCFRETKEITDSENIKGLTRYPGNKNRLRCKFYSCKTYGHCAYVDTKYIKPQE